MAKILSFLKDGQAALGDITAENRIFRNYYTG